LNVYEKKQLSKKIAKITMIFGVTNLLKIRQLKNVWEQGRGKAENHLDP